jgi:hypothetical protein
LDIENSIDEHLKLPRDKDLELALTNSLVYSPSILP